MSKDQVDVAEVASIIYRHQELLENQSTQNSETKDLLRACHKALEELNMLPLQTKTTIAGTINSEYGELSEKILKKFDNELTALSQKVNHVKQDIDQVNLYNKKHAIKFLLTCTLTIGVAVFIGSWFFWKKFPPQNYVNVQKLETLNSQYTSVTETTKKKR